MSLLEQASLVLVPSGYKAGKVYSQVPTNGDGDLTFTRASDATRVNSAGLIEKVRTNLLLQSNTFDTTPWFFVGTPTLTANYDTNPLTGENDAWRFLAAGVGDRLVQAISGSNSAFSLYAKGSGIIRIQDSSATYNANLTLTSSWQRVSLHIPASFTNVQITSNGGCDATIYAAQLETGDIATDYIPTTTTAVSVGMTANVPRLDYSGGSCPSLLLEPQRTNLAVNSENWSGTGWIAESASVTSNSVISPSGYQDADTLTGTNNFPRLRQSGFALADNTDYTISSFLKAGTAYVVTLSITNKAGTTTEYDFNLQDGTAQSGAKIEDYGNGWYRCLFTANSGSGATTTSVRFASNDFGTTGGWTNGLTIYAWGAQLEAGSYPTSYIPTLGATVTRVADACSKTGISDLIGQTEGTLFAEFDIPSNTENGDIIAVRVGTSSANGFFVSYRSSSVVQLIVRISSTNALIFQRTGAYPIGKNKLAVAYKNGDFAISLNGTATQVNTSTITMPTSLDSVVLFGGNLYAQTLPIPYAEAILYKTRLTNSELATLTTL